MLFGQTLCRFTVRISVESRVLFGWVWNLRWRLLQLSKSPLHHFNFYDLCQLNADSIRPGGQTEKERSCNASTTLGDSCVWRSDSAVFGNDRFEGTC